MKQPQVVIVGHICIDQNVAEHATYRSWGGPALYIESYYRKQHSLRARVITTYGSDLLPFIDDIDLIPSKPQASHSMMYRNVMNAGKRTLYCEHADYARPRPLDDTAIAALKAADICIVAPLAPNYSIEHVKRILSYCTPQCVKLLGPQGYFRHIGTDGSVSPRDFKEAEELLPLFDMTVLSDEDHPQVRAQADRWKKLPGVNNIVMTHGPLGASILRAEGDQLIPTKAVPEEDVVDSVGCGDVFEGSLAYEYYRLRDVPSAVAEAHKAARRKLLAHDAHVQGDLIALP